MWNISKYVGIMILGLSTLVAGPIANAEVKEVVFARQFGIGYLPLIVMHEHQLVEKHLAKEGLEKTKVSWKQFGSGAVVNDALLSGGVAVGSGGVGPFLLLWDRTRSNLGVKAIGALTSMPNKLLTVNPDLETLEDYGPKDKISLTGAGSSVQTTILQKAVADIWGMENYNRLAPNMVNLPHPEGLRAMLSGSGDVESLLTSPPYTYDALGDDRVHTVFNSYDVFDGKRTTFLVAWATTKFAQKNPKTLHAIQSALDEAQDWINDNKNEAAKLYADSNRTSGEVEDIMEMLNDPDNVFTSDLENFFAFAEFMEKTGLIKNLPENIDDVMFKK